MSHIHSSSGCACCSAMGVKFDFAKPDGKPQEARQRVTTQGMDHLYVAADTVQVEVVESSMEVPVNASDLEALQMVVKEQLEQIEEQTRRLEAASYRIGYLEAQLGSRDEQLKLLTTAESGSDWWTALCNWFK